MTFCYCSLYLEEAVRTVDTEKVLSMPFFDLIIVTGRGKRSIEDHFDSAFELEWHFTSQTQLLSFTITYSHCWTDVYG